MKKKWYCRIAVLALSMLLLAGNMLCPWTMQKLHATETGIDVKKASLLEIINTAKAIDSTKYTEKSSGYNSAFGKYSISHERKKGKCNL